MLLHEAFLFGASFTVLIRALRPGGNMIAPDLPSHHTREPYR